MGHGWARRPGEGAKGSARPHRSPHPRGRAVHAHPRLRLAGRPGSQLLLVVSEAHSPAGNSKKKRSGHAGEEGRGGPGAGGVSQSGVPPLAVPPAGLSRPGLKKAILKTEPAPASQPRFQVCGFPALRGGQAVRCILGIVVPPREARKVRPGSKCLRKEPTGDQGPGKSGPSFFCSPRSINTLTTVGSTACSPPAGRAPWPCLCSLAAAHRYSTCPILSANGARRLGYPGATNKKQLRPLPRRKSTQNG